MLFGTASDMVQVLAMAAASYAAVVIILRVSGKRTLAKLNAFDLVVTVALGSILATSALSSEVELTEGIVAASVLVTAQYLVAWASVRSRVVRKAVRAQPVLLVRDGNLLDDAMQRNRVSAGEVHQAIRSASHGGLESIGAVVLESDGSFSVIPSSAIGSGDALAEVEGHGDRAD